MPRPKKRIMRTDAQKEALLREASTQPNLNAWCASINMLPASFRSLRKRYLAAHPEFNPSTETLPAVRLEVNLPKRFNRSKRHPVADEITRMKLAEYESLSQGRGGGKSA